MSSTATAGPGPGAAVDALDPILGQLDELAVGALRDVGLVVRARLFQAPQQILALGHHEQRGGARFDLVGALELDQRLRVFTRVEQFQSRLVMATRRLRGLIRAHRATGDGAEQERERKQSGDERLQGRSG